MILVTGGAGFIGSHLVGALVARGESVRVLDNFSTGKKTNLTALSGKIDLIEGDIRNPDICRTAMKGVAVVFHQAALPSVPRSIKDPISTHDVNVTGTVNLLIVARDNGVRRFIYASSSSVYGDTPVLPKVETMAPNPLSPYAASKLSGEYYARVFSPSFGLQTVSLRYFNIYGPRQDPDSPYAAVIPLFVKNLREGRPPTIFGNGEQTRDFTFVSDCVAANLAAAEAEGVSGEVFNVAGGREVSINTLAGTLARRMKIDILPVYAPPRPGDVLRSLADVAKSKKFLKWEARIDIEEGLAKTLS